MTNCREATFPENTAKILNTSRVKGKDKRFLDYSYFLLPAKITDGASYKRALKALLFRKPGESANFLHSFGKMTIHYPIALNL